MTKSNQTGIFSVQAKHTQFTYDGGGNEQITLRIFLKTTGKLFQNPISPTFET
jgi:hypothetical protein